MVIYQGAKMPTQLSRQSYRLLTDRSWVRVPRQAPLLACWRRGLTHMPFTHTFMGSNPVQVTKISKIPIEKQGFILHYIDVKRKAFERVPFRSHQTARDSLAFLFKMKKYVSVKDFRTRTIELIRLSSGYYYWRIFNEK